MPPTKKKANETVKIKPDFITFAMKYDTFYRKSTSKSTAESQQKVNLKTIGSFHLHDFMTLG